MFFTFYFFFYVIDMWVPLDMQALLWHAMSWMKRVKTCLDLYDKFEDSKIYFKSLGIH